MGSVGDADDHALAEAFFATLECGLLGRRHFPSQAKARIAAFPFIEGFHNPTRRHSSLGYLSPIELEARKMLMRDWSLPANRPWKGGAFNSNFNP